MEENCAGVGAGGAVAGEAGGSRVAALRVIGLGALLAWSNLVFFSKLIHYSTRNGITHLNSVYTFACLGTAVALLAVWALWRLVSPRMPRAGGDEGPKPFSVAWMSGHADVAALSASVLASVSTAILIMVEHRLFTQPWCSIFSTAAGMGLGILYLVWAHAFSGVRRHQLGVQLGLAFAAGAAAYVAVLYLPETLGWVVCTLLPPASYAAFRRWSAKAASEAPAQPVDLDEAAALGMYRPKRGYLIRTFLALFLVGVAESFERALFMSLNPVTENAAYHWALLVSALVAVLVIVSAALATKGRRRAVGTNRSLMFVMTVLFLLAPIVEGYWLWADMATMTCHFLFYLLIWSVLVRMSGEYRISVCATFAPGMGFASLGCTAGTFAGGLVMSFAVPGYRMLSLLALACAVLAMLSFVFLLNDDVVVDLINSDDVRPTGPRRFELRCREVAAQYGLSNRETEVMILAAKGRTNQRIQAELGISAGTVNTHFAHIYKKLDVHDRQQMLDMIDERG